MLTLLLGTDWIANREYILQSIADDVAHERPNRILIVPELISHDTERRLCKAAGDTASRFAEVLSFKRLYRRVSDFTGRMPRECLDNAGRLAAMAASVRQLHSKLKSYASVETRPEFLLGLVDAVDEFKRCCISAEDLMKASQLTDGLLAQKLEELSLIYEAYDSFCQHGRRDPSDQMTWLLQQLEDSDFAQKHVFYIDGFPDFTRQHMEILNHLIRGSQQVVVSMNCDVLRSGNPAFSKAGDSASTIFSSASKFGVEVQIIQIPPRTDALQTMRNNLFSRNIPAGMLSSGCLSVYRTKSVYDECVAAAECIMDLVHNGARYREMAVVLADQPGYRNTLNMVFQRCGIPVYQSGNDDILEKPIINTVLAAVDAALGDFENHELIRYMKSLLSPLPMAACDRIENYVFLWSIRGRSWEDNWSFHPQGLAAQWTDADRSELEYLNADRARMMEPLILLRKQFREASNVCGQVDALYTFFEKIHLYQRLQQLAQKMQANGDLRNAQMLSQLWDILLTALEQLHDILGKAVWDGENFSRLLRLMLTQYDVGSIPTVLDSVMVGPVRAMRCQEAKYLFVLGAEEGNLPGYSGSAGILTDQERNMLRRLGVPLTGGGEEGVQAEFAEIYGVFCGATDTVYISCSAGEPSFIYRRLLKLAGTEAHIDITLGPARSNRAEASAFLLRWNREDIADSLELLDTYQRIKGAAHHTFGRLDSENISELYGDRLTLSASQIDRQAECRLMYFLRYGLRAKERKPAAVDPSEFGTFVHDVLERTVNDVMQSGGFHSVSLEQTLRIAADHVRAYIDSYFNQLTSERLQYLLNRNEQELLVIVKELWEELSTGSFEPAYCELAFGYDGKIDAIPIEDSTLQASLGGKVDRVDRWEHNGQTYYRVVDYKTGRKDFDYCDIFNGYGLQMLLYLFALETENDVVGQSPIPAGVQYFPARSPLISSDGLLADEEAEMIRLKNLSRKGLLLADEDVITAMDPTEKMIRLSCSHNKNGELTGDIASRTQFNLLKAYISMQLRQMVNEIASGRIDPNPYTRGTSHNACTYCPYGSICCDANAAGRRNFKAMSSQRFWEEVEKAVNHGG